MRLSTRLCIFVWAIATTCGTALGQTCPPCYNDQGWMPARHGYGTDGRQISTVLVDTTGMTNAQAAAVSSATDAALTMWNEATNPSVAPDQYNYQIQYNFETTSDPYRADFIIKKGNALFGCASIDMSVYPYVITLGSTGIDTYAENLIGTIAHEIAHRIGIGHPGDDTNSNCDTDASIMQGATNIATCLGGTLHVTGSDVAQANKIFFLLVIAKYTRRRR